MYFLSVNRNADFLKSTLPSLVIFPCLSKILTIYESISVYKRTPLRHFRYFSYVGRIIKCHEPCKCLSTVFVRVFCMAHVNIEFIILPTLEKSKKGERCPLYIGAYFADCKMLKDTKLKTEVCFKKI